MATQQSDSQTVATPMAFPDSGTFDVTQRITLLTTTAGATVHYTLDGGAPDATSSAFNPFDLIPLEAVNDGNTGLKRAYTLKAVAIKAGMPPSAVATFSYTIDRRDKDAYISREVLPGIHLISDYDNTKMMVVLGSTRALLVDAGMGAGDLLGFVKRITGDLPLDVAITHGHGDHISCMRQFQAGHKVYMNHLDLPMVKRSIASGRVDLDPERILDLREGFVFDLGDRSLHVYEVPGHSPGCLVLFDEVNGVLFAGDAVGQTRATIPDALWLQSPGLPPVDILLSALQIFRAKVKGRIKVTLSGHNDMPIYGEAFFDNVERAAQNVVNFGEGALMPSLRPTGFRQSVEGNRLSDPNWIGINLPIEGYLSRPPGKMATLSNLQVAGGALTERFHPATTRHEAVVPAGTRGVDVIPTATSQRHYSLMVNGRLVRSGARCHVPLTAGAATQVDLCVTAPDGVTIEHYTLAIRRG